MGKKVALAAFLFIVGVLFFLVFSLPKMVDPAEQLIAVAKRVAAGPRSPEDAKNAKAAFDEAVKKILLKYGSEESVKLSKRLKNCLPANAFEVLVVDLPKGLKLVEVDTVLQASDFLVMKGTNDTRVIPLPGFEVFDDARAVNDQAGAVIVLLGHTGGQGAHKPLVMTYALLPDSVVDETASMVPSILGEGVAKFDKDTSDINVELSLPTVAQLENIKMNPPVLQDKPLKVKLQWKDAKYLPTMEFPAEPDASMLLLARSLKYPDYAGSVTASFGELGGKLMKEQASTELRELSVQKKGENKKSLSYSIASAKGTIDLELKKAGSTYHIASYSVKAPRAVTPETASNPVMNPGTSKASDDPSVPVNSPSETKSSTESKSDLPGGLSPEIAGRNKGDKQNSENADKPSSWLDDNDKASKGDEHKPPVAVLPPGLRNEKNKAEQEREKRDRDKKAQEEKTAREKLQKEKEPAEQASAQGFGKIAESLGTNSVRLRSGPGLNMQTLDEIPKGTRIQILGQKKGWYKVSHNGKVGYVFAPLVDTSSGTSQKTPVAENRPATPDKSSNPPVSASPSSSGGGATVVRVMTVRNEQRRAISAVKVGQHVTLLSDLKNNRYKIRMPDGTVGYVHKDALDVKVETPPEFVP